MRLLQKIQVQGQQLERKSLSKIVADSRNMVGFAFEFDKVWEGVEKTAVITTGGERYPCLIEADGTISEAHMPVLKAGEASVTVVGGNLYTTGEYRFNVVESGGVSMPDFIPPDLYSQVLERASSALSLATDQQNTAAVNAQTAVRAAQDSAGNAEKAEAAALSARQSEMSAKGSGESAKISQQGASQAYSDFLRQLGTDVATLVNGKIPAGQIPAIATTEIYTVDSQAAMNALEVQNGDICIRNDEEKSYIYNGGWVRLASPTDYASRAGHAETAAAAETASTINGHRLVEISAGEFASAVKDENTYYLVWG